MADCAKQRYATRRAARQVLRSLAGKGKPCRGCHPYFCDACGCFHIGHMAPAIRRGVITRGEIYG